MKLVFPSHFQKGNLKISGAVSNSPGVDSNVDLESIIQEYEKELFIRALGPEQYNILLRVIDHVVKDWFGWTRLTDQFGNLLTFTDEKGVTKFITVGDQLDHALYSYTECDRDIAIACWNELLFGNTGYWNGLQDMLAKYIWCQYQKFHAVEQSVLGPMKPDSVGGSRASNRRNYVNRWNEVCLQYQYLQKFLHDSPCFESYWYMSSLFQTKTSVL